MGSHLLNWGQALEQKQDIWRKRTCQPKCGFLWTAYKSRWLKISLRLSTNTDQIYTNIWILNNIWILKKKKLRYKEDDWKSLWVCEPAWTHWLSCPMSPHSTQRRTWWRSSSSACSSSSSLSSSCHRYHHHRHHNYLQVILCQQGGSPPMTNWPHNFGSSANKCLIPLLCSFSVWPASIPVHHPRNCIDSRAPGSTSK